jgi:phage shock protein C
MARRKKAGFVSNRRCGWGMDLYRNRREGWIGGVCAGLGDHWGVPNWMVRLAAVALLIFTGTLAFWGYILGIVLLASRPDERACGDCESVEMEYDESIHRYRPKKAFRYAAAPTERLRAARERLDGALDRVTVMERYVTSRRYELNQKFSKL